MAFGDEKVVVDVKDIDRGEILYTEEDGKGHTYYPCNSNWLEMEFLEVLTALGEPKQEGAEPLVVVRVRGIARLEDRSISVVGDPGSKTMTLSVSFEVGDWKPREDEETKELMSFITPLGGAMLGFNRADWEIGNDSKWWMSCYVPKALHEAMISEVHSGRLTTARVGVALRGLYTTEHSYAPISRRGDLFIRPNKRDNTIKVPEMASGYVRSVYFSSAKVDLRKPEPVEDEDPSFSDELSLAPLPVDPIVAAIDELSARVEKLRGTLKWIIGLVVIALLFVASK